MAIQNLDTQTSPGIGVLPDGVGFAPLGGCIIDLKGLNGQRLTAQIATSRMFRGWTGPDGGQQAAPYPPAAWLRITSETFDPTNLPTLMGGGLAKANIRITLYDGDSGSPNPVYVAQFGAGNFPYRRWSEPPQPGNYDFDGGQNLYIAFENTAGVPVSCGYMGERTTYRLADNYATIESFTGFPGVFAMTDGNVIYPGGPPPPRTYPPPPQYLPPFAVTGWFTVPTPALAALWAVVLTGTIQIGVHDVTPGDQYYDFMQGLASDVQNIPLLPTTPAPTITCGNPPAGTVGIGYSHRMPYSVGTPTHTLLMTAGSLPTGLSIDNLGFITGVPTINGNFGFTVTLTDADAHAAPVSCTIDISPAASSFGNVAF